MRIDCNRCRHTLEYSGDCPRFCSHCGNALDETAEAVTLPPSDTGAGTVSAAGAGTVQAPSTIAGYRLLRVLGAGGMGSVYEAEHIASGRRVALKLISPQVAASASTVERFRQEGRLASTVSHPRCVFVLAADTDAGRPFIVMELMPGSTLQDLLDTHGPLPSEQAVAKILDVIDGLLEAHRRGVIHRDVKPSNCFVDVDDRVKIGDFGLSRTLDGGAQLTKTGSFLGTPLYASPEQVRGDRLDLQTDVYSVSATLYALIAGKAPFHTGDAAATLARIAADAAPPLRSVRPEVSPALDRVILRGLERDRSRRWRDLAQFREALLPFAPGHLSIGGLGIRFGAYILDWIILYLLSLPWTFLVLSDLEFMTDPSHAVPKPWFLLAGTATAWLYYGVPEGLWGCAVGKWLLRLRVRKKNGVDPPGIARATLRAMIYHGCFSLGVTAGTIWWQMAVPTDLPAAQVYVYLNFFNLFNLTGMLVGLAALLSPMRTRNGYRGLHEWLSGTRVVALPPLPPRRWLASARSERPALRRGDVPASLGAFTVHGILCETGHGLVLRGDDPGLERPVWIWRRGADAPPLSAGRRELGRATRLRWLAKGSADEQPWDAFLAPAGAPLADIVRERGAQDWHFVQHWLAQLADELRSACADGTLPADLTVQNVWICDDGRLVLLEFPLADAPAFAPVPADNRADDAEKASVQQRALALFTAVAVWSLEGEPRAGRAAVGRIRARLPLYAARLLDPLVAGEAPVGGPKTVHTALIAMLDRPPSVSRWRRLGQIGIWIGLLCLGPIWCICGVALIPVFAAFGPNFRLLHVELTLENLEQGAARELAAGLLHPHPLCRLAPIARYQQDMALRDRLRVVIEQDREEVAARQAHSNRVTRAWLDATMRVQTVQIRQQMETQRARAVDPNVFRREAEWNANRDGRDYEHVGMFIAGGICSLIWPVVWVLWAFAWRGGISFWLGGIALVRADGRLAPRWRCAWRALLFWLLPIALLMAAFAVDLAFWSNWRDPAVAWLPWLSFALWWCLPILLAIYGVLALWDPSRSLHDRLAGTYLVPR